MKLKLIFASLLLLLILPHITLAAGGAFTFTLPSSARTSAGVYKVDGTLVRTLWSGEQYTAGTYTKSWDGLTDDGVTAPNDTYSIKVLSNNVKYEWEGARIGNTSADLTGDKKHRLFDPSEGLAIIGNTAYVAGGYNEAWPAQYKFSLTDPQRKTWVGRLRTTDQASNFVASDGMLVYWAGFDPRQTNETFVFATQASNDALVSFGGNGTTAQMEWGGVYSAIAYKNVSNSIITGMAVQQSGNYLFVSRAPQNELQVLNKTTGALVRTLTITGVAKSKFNK